MGRTTTLLLTVGAVALGVTSMAGVSLADGRGGGPHRGASWFELFDVDENGRLTQAEIDGVRSERLAEFDANGDGVLDLEEYQALWMAAMRSRMVDRFQDLDEDGDARVTVEEFVAPTSRVVSRLDSNDDGELSADEMHQRRGDRDHRRDRDRDDD